MASLGLLRSLAGASQGARSIAELLLEQRLRQALMEQQFEGQEELEASRFEREQEAKKKALEEALAQALLGAESRLSTEFPQRSSRNQELIRSLVEAGDLEGLKGLESRFTRKSKKKRGKPVSVPRGSRLVDPRTGEILLDAEEGESRGGFEFRDLGEVLGVFDRVTGEQVKSVPKTRGRNTKVVGGQIVDADTGEVVFSGEEDSDIPVSTLNSVTKSAANSADLWLQSQIVLQLRERFGGDDNKVSLAIEDASNDASSDKGKAFWFAKFPQWREEYDRIRADSMRGLLEEIRNLIEDDFPLSEEEAENPVTGRASLEERWRQAQE